MSFAWAGALLPLFLMSWATAFAADGDDPSLGLGETRIVEQVLVTATRREQASADVAVAATVVGADAILRQPTAVVAELLRGVPGAAFQQTTPGQGIPIVRGLKGSQVLHLVDGMRLNNAFFRSAPNQYVALVDAFVTERVEVVRGAAASLYGADAMGGVVQFLTRQPHFEGSDWRTKGRLYGSYESADDGIALRAEASGGRDGVGISGGVTYRDHGDRRTADGTVRPSAYEVEAADFTWLGSLSPDSGLMLSAQLLEQPSTPRIDELVPGYGQDEPASAQFRFEPNRRSFVHARYVLERDFGWFKRMELHLARQVITDDRVTQDFGDPVVTSEENESTLDGLIAQFDSDLAGGAHVVWGFELYRDEVDSFRSESIPGEFPPMAVRSRFPDGSEMDSFAVYANSEWRPGKRLDIWAGLRWSTFDISLPAAGEQPQSDLEPDDLTGDLHIVYALSDAVKLVANLGRGFRPPNIFDLGTLGARPGNRFNIANPDLDPESVWSYDLGFKIRQDGWQAELFAWYSDYEDKITSVLTGGLTEEGRIIVRSENRNEVTLYGLEAGLTWWPTDDIEVYGTLNYTRGEESEAGEYDFPADRIPPLNGRLGAAWKPDSRLRAEAYWLFASEQDRLSPRDVRDPRIDPLGTAGWGTLNLSLSWQWRSNLQIGLNLENLGDKSFREHGSGIDAPGFNAGVWVNATF